MKIAGICVFRNAGDVIGLVILHHLLTLVDHVYCLDNGSTDGGPERVAWLSRRSGRVDIVTDPANRPKREYMTELARRAHRDGYDVILPFDSDEIWNGTRARLREGFADGHNVLRCRVLNFIQRRSVATPSWLSWRHATRRCRTVDTSRVRVTNGENSFLEWDFPSKVAFLTDPSLVVQKGQHGVERAGHREIGSDSIEVFHLPMRARSEILKRARDYEPRRAQHRADPNDGWQGLYWQKRVVEGQVDREWQALSYDGNGELLVNDRRVPTFIDRRLVGLLYRAALMPRYGLAGLHMLKVPESTSLYDGQG